MTFKLNSYVEHILILGAGASADYGLPMWKGLSILMKEKINGDTEKYQYKEEMIAWIDKVGQGKEYSTIDECIEKESTSTDYYSNGDEIEDQIFIVMHDVLKDAYKESSNGWIRKFNIKILSDATPRGLEHKIAFINYNYDDVLDRNFLVIDLPSKHLRWNRKPRLEELSTVNVNALFAHGTFPLDEKDRKSSHIERYFQTMKSDDNSSLDVVSCYESQKHIITKSTYDTSKKKLYILGLGGGLEVNLNNITFQVPVSEIHITIRDSAKKEKVTKFLSEKFSMPAENIKTYESCDELVDKCFN